jgi:hypothetical protein
MPIVERTDQRLMLKSGSTTLTLDRSTNTATLQRKLLLWALRPAESSLSDVIDVRTDVAVDRASGVEVCHSMLVMAGGQAWAFPSADKNDAEANTSALRQFIGFPT